MTEGLRPLFILESIDGLRWNVPLGLGYLGWCRTLQVLSFMSLTGLEFSAASPTAGQVGFWDCWWMKRGLLRSTAETERCLWSRDQHWTVCAWQWCSFTQYVSVKCTVYTTWQITNLTIVPSRWLRRWVRIPSSRLLHTGGSASTTDTSTARTRLVTCSSQPQLVNDDKQRDQLGLSLVLMIMTRPSLLSVCK